MSKTAPIVSANFRLACLSLEQLPSTWEGESLSVCWMRNGIIGGQTQRVLVVGGCVTWNQTLEIRTKLQEDPATKKFAPRLLNLHLKGGKEERVVQVNLAAYAQHECETRQTFSLFENSNSFIILRFSCEWVQINDKRLVRVCGVDASQIPENHKILLGEKEYTLVDIATDFSDDLAPDQETPLVLNRQLPDHQDQTDFGKRDTVEAEPKMIPQPIEKPCNVPLVDESIAAQDIGYSEEITKGKTNQVLYQLDQSRSATSGSSEQQQQQQPDHNMDHVLKQAQEELIEAKKVKSEYENLIKSLNRQIESKDEECEALKRQIESKDEKCEALKRQTEPKDEECEALKRQIKSKDEEYEALKRQIESKDKESDALRRQIESKAEEYEALKRQLLTTEQIEHKWQEKLELKDNMIDALQQEKRSIEQKRIEQSSKSSGLQIAEQKHETHRIFWCFIVLFFLFVFLSFC